MTQSNSKNKQEANKQQQETSKKKSAKELENKEKNKQDFANDEFWQYFNEFAAPKLAAREVSMRKVFEYLDTCEGAITIVETGCARIQDNWSGDGQSTLLFDRYVNARGQGSHVYSVDIDAQAVATCSKQVSANTTVTVSDSVHYLYALSRELQDKQTAVQLFYLDSFDADMTYWFASAAHHLKELAAVMRIVTKKTLIVVDDAPLTSLLLPNPSDSSQFQIASSLQIGGKGRLVAEYAQQVGIPLYFAHYQAAWLGF